MGPYLAYLAAIAVHNLLFSKSTTSFHSHDSPNFNPQICHQGSG